jgi:predicted RNase H-like HicB family nuclease
MTGLRRSANCGAGGRLQPNWECANENTLASCVCCPRGLCGNVALDNPSARGKTRMTTVHVKATYDPDAKVWYVEQSTLSGVFAEGETVEELAGKLPDIVEDLTGTRSPVEFEAHMRVS